MATNAGAGAARQLQSARTATAVWKVSVSWKTFRAGLKAYRSTLCNLTACGSEFEERSLWIQNDQLVCP